MKNRQWAMGLVLAGLMSGAAQAAIYDATADFSITRGNPNGVWSYGYMPWDFSSFIAHSATTTPPNNFDIWYTPGLSGDYTPHVAVNNGVDAAGIPHGQLTLHPGPGGQVADLRFTASTDGVYDVVGQFFAGNWGVMQVGVRQGSNWLWNATDAGSFSLQNQMLAAGQTLDFVVYGGYGWGSTGLALTISSDTGAVPEPTTLALTLAALGLAGLRRRSRATS